MMISMIPINGWMVHTLINQTGYSRIAALKQTSISLKDDKTFFEIKIYGYRIHIINYSSTTVKLERIMLLINIESHARNITSQIQSTSNYLTKSRKSLVTQIIYKIRSPLTSSEHMII
eukprot:TRINITY_DN12132_c0_g1_i2.p1 TRINITY_DN12132_c0_g1~~TRINITY_DN12132_c0_g1_i2.p1  ORF type:complete len:118 (-),score=0.54 TRINITY_DN12132_c0_g1_i2:766-1119(-)